MVHIAVNREPPSDGSHRPGADWVVAHLEDALAAGDAARGTYEITTQFGTMRDDPNENETTPHREPGIACRAIAEGG